MTSRRNPGWGPRPPGEPAEDEGAVAGPLEDFDEVYTRHEASVERWVRRLGGPGVDVEDLIHDVFVVAFGRRSSFRGDAQVSTWLFGITRHVVSRRRRRDRVRAWLGLGYRTAAPAFAPMVPTPLEELERWQDERRLYQALDRLSEADRTVLVLYDIDGLTADQVAALIGVSTNTVWVRVHRARARLCAIVGVVPGGEGPR